MQISNRRLIITSISAAPLAVWAASAGEWPSAALLIGIGLTALGWYLTFRKVHVCNGPAPTTSDGICDNAERGGIVRGCYLHRWWRLKRLFYGDAGRRRGDRRDDRSLVGSSVSLSQPNSPGSSMFVTISGWEHHDPVKQRIAFSLAMISAAAGVTSAATGVVMLAIQFGLIGVPTPI